MVPSLETVFFAALEKGSAAERAGYLDEACAGDPAMRKKVERMLAAQIEAGSFLETPAAEIDRTIVLPAANEAPGTVIGRYKILEEIAEGGMGMVYMAEQLEPVRRKVALKIVKPGMDTREVIARFEAERQALAIMDHPNIAKVFDAGETESGRPYFVMELVHGIPLTEYCDKNELMIRERLELFVEVCQTIHHAHQKGIIHRDVKPSNVMVTQRDGTAVPKVIDFGIAKALHGPLTERTLFTHYGQMIGTPLYMSPEQAQMSDLDVDTRSDIYSLGVMLYELLTGSTPFDQERVKKAGYDEVRRIIREDEPPPPSTRVSTLKAEQMAVFLQRKTDPSRLGSLLRRDLDWIVMKSLEKDRTRRYHTTSDFAQDVQRYLAGEPVSAAPPSARYQLGKWIRRHRRIVSFGAVFLFGGAAAAIAISVVMLVSTREGTVKLEFSDAAAARKCVVAIDGNKIGAENLGEPIKLPFGKHQLRVRRGNMEIEAREFDVPRQGMQVLYIAIPAHPRRIVSGAVTLTGVTDPYALAFDTQGNLFVANAADNTTVSEFAPGSTTPTATLTGVSGPTALVFDSSGNLYVANSPSNTVSKFAPGSTSPTATLTGLNDPYVMAFDSKGNLFVINCVGDTVSEFAPGSTTPSATLTGVKGPQGMAFDSRGDLFVVNQGNNTVSEFAPGSTTPTATLTGLNHPQGIAFDSRDNLFVPNVYGDTVSEFAPGSTTPSATLTGLTMPAALAFDANGNLFVANVGSGMVSEFAPGSTTPTAALLGLDWPIALAFDSRGNLYVANANANTVSKFAPSAAARGRGARAEVPTGQ